MEKSLESREMPAENLENEVDTEKIQKLVECFKELTVEEKIKRLSQKVEKAEKKHSKNQGKLREIEKETKRIRAEMIETGKARLKKLAEMDELELKALSLAKRIERKRTRNFFKGVPSLLINDERISPGAKAVFALLQSRIPDKKMIDYPKVEIAVLTIAKRMGVTYDTAKKYLKELQAFGWIEVERRGKRLTNAYILYGIKTHDFNMIVKIKAADLRIVRGSELKKKLTSSLEK